MMRRTLNIWWVIAAFACLLIAFFTYSSKLSATIEEMQSVIEESSVRLTALQAEKAELEAMLKSAGTDAFIENQARNEYDYMMPDEIRFVITTSEDTSANKEMPSP